MENRVLCFAGIKCIIVAHQEESVTSAASSDTSDAPDINVL